MCSAVLAKATIDVVAAPALYTARRVHTCPARFAECDCQTARAPARRTIPPDLLLYFVNGLGETLHPFGTPVAGSQMRYNGDFGALLIEATSTQITFRFVSRIGQVIDISSLHKSCQQRPLTGASARCLGNRKGGLERCQLPKPLPLPKLSRMLPDAPLTDLSFSVLHSFIRWSSE
jgi:hypothetical protein